MRAFHRGIVGLCCTMLLLVGAGAAHAGQPVTIDVKALTPAGTNDPVVGVPRVWQISGNNPGNNYVRVVMYKPGAGSQCTSTFDQNFEQGAWGGFDSKGFWQYNGSSTGERFFYDVSTAGLFNVQVPQTFSAIAGDWGFCAYSVFNGSDITMPAPTMQRFTFRAPNSSLAATVDGATGGTISTGTKSVRISGSTETATTVWVNLVQGTSTCSASAQGSSGTTASRKHDVAAGTFAETITADGDYKLTQGKATLCVWLANSGSDAPLQAIQQHYTVGAGSSAPSVKKKCRVPRKLVGNTAAQARRRLVANNCRVTVRRIAARNSRVKRGRVVRHSHKAGRAYAKNTRVTIFVRR